MPDEEINGSSEPKQIQRKADSKAVFGIRRPSDCTSGPGSPIETCHKCGRALPIEGEQPTVPNQYPWSGTCRCDRPKSKGYALVEHNGQLIRVPRVPLGRAKRLHGPICRKAKKEGIAWRETVEKAILERDGEVTEIQAQVIHGATVAVITRSEIQSRLDEAGDDLSTVSADKRVTWQKIIMLLQREIYGVWLELGLPMQNESRGGRTLELPFRPLAK